MESLQWKQPQHSGQGLQSEGSVQIPRATHSQGLALTPICCSSVTMALKFILAVTSGLVKLNHSCWTCPEEILGRDRGRGHSSKTQCYCYYGFFILLRGFCGDFEAVTAIFQSEK